MAETAYDYTITVARSGKRLFNEVKADAGCGAPVGVDVTGTAVKVTMAAAQTAPQKTALDAIVAEHDDALVQAQEAREAQVRVKTRTLLVFTHAGRPFLITPNTCIFYGAMDHRRNIAKLDLPIGVLDANKRAYAVTTTADAMAMYDAMVARYRVVMLNGGSETDIIDQIYAATTPAAVLAVPDNRT